jgi:hypothetical protein
MSQPISDLALPSSYANYLAASSYTAGDVLAKLLTVDGPGSGLDADTVSGYGIGAYTILADNYEINNLIVPGRYAVTNPYLNGSLFLARTFGIDVIAYNSGNIIQFLHVMESVSGFYKRIRSGGTWYPGTGTATYIYDSWTDGNGGQPPAPKPSRYNATIVQGRWLGYGGTGACDVYANGTTSAGFTETFSYWYTEYDAAGALVATFDGDVAAASLKIRSVPAGYQYRILTWRQS